MAKECIMCGKSLLGHDHLVQFCNKTCAVKKRQELFREIDEITHILNHNKQYYEFVKTDMQTKKGKI